MSKTEKNTKEKIIRNLDSQKKQAILVLGMHRSGTSAVARVLNLLGAKLPENLMPPLPDNNELGFWESRDLMIIHDDILRSVDMSWGDMGVFPESWWQSSAAMGFKETLLEYLHKDFLNSHLFVIKDPRLCRLFPLWLDVLSEFNAEPMIVMPIRNPLEVAASLEARDKIQSANSYLLWLRYVVDAECSTRNVRRSFIRYEDLLLDWQKTVGDITTNLGVDWPKRPHSASIQIGKFLRNKMRHHKSDSDQLNLDPDVSEWISRTYQALNLLIEKKDNAAIEILDSVTKELRNADTAFVYIFSEQKIKIRELEQERTRLLHDLEKNKDDQILHRTALDEAEGKLERRDKELSQLRKDLGQARETITSRTTEVSRLADEIKHRDRELSQLQKNLGQARETITARTEEVEQLTNAASEKEEEFGSLLKQRNQLSYRLNAYQTQSSRGSMARFLGFTKRPFSKAEYNTKVLPPREYFGVSLQLRERHRLRRLANELLAKRLFDVVWYIERNPDVVINGGNPVWHWLVVGWRKGRDPNPLFDTDWYLTENPDVTDAGVNPLVHYLEHGAAEGRDPNPLFDTDWYLMENPDVADAGVNPLVHYLEHGAAEGRDPNPLFDTDRYQTENPGVADARINPLVHYLEHRAAESLAPNSGITAKHLAAALAAVEDNDIGRCSVVLPTWNRRNTIVRSIKSILSQSYLNWELIICDDGSNDGTEELVREQFTAEISSGQIRYLSLPHRGVSATRNAGLHIAEGSWVAYLDSDNVWNEHYLLITAAGYAKDRYRRTAYAGLRVHDKAGKREFVRCQGFNWGRLLKQNFIDLNVFSHHRGLYDQLGGFDESLTRLVDWDLILRYTQLYEPKFNSQLLADYYVSHSLNNISLNEPLEHNETAVRRKFATVVIRSGITPLRIGYVLWDWPALSQTFVLEEIRELLNRNIDVRVYYATSPDRAAEDVPDVIALRISDVDELAEMLVRDERNWIHSHFAYPAVTKLVWPVAEKTGIAFSFMPHAVDIFHRDNRERNRIGEIASSSLCARVMVYGEHHRGFLIDCGVPAHKLIMTPQAVDTKVIRAERIALRKRVGGEPLRVLTIGRFIEKKGIEDMINAIARLDPGSIVIRVYGYGPLESTYRSLIRQQGLEDSVQLCGVFEGADALGAAMDWADVLCLPCVEAENGDMDGMPTVFFEAMAAGVPCIAGAVSAIPDFITDGINGFLIPPRDVENLASTLKRIAAMPEASLTCVAETARNWADEHIGSRYTIDTLLDSCSQPPLDIFMVTYHRDGHGSWKATERSIRSILDHTNTPFLLTIVDNGSETAILHNLREIVRGEERVRLIELGENRWSGPASNLALELAQSEFVFYVCSNEGYIVRNGWERSCLRFMRNRPNVALGGHLVSSPSWHDGAGYMRQPWFTDFRNTEFAENNPDRPFAHVQGGLWVLRRSVFEAHGGFNRKRPQAQMDVEYSYYLESLGYKLGDIPGLLAVSNKTRPKLDAFLDEGIVAAHPVFDDTLELLDACVRSDSCRCNVCGWLGNSERLGDGVSFHCPACDSSPRDRAAFRWLAGSDLHHRGKTLDGRGLGHSVRTSLETIFSVVDEEAAVCVPDLIPGHPSRMLGIPPTSLTIPLTVTPPMCKVKLTLNLCNICGGDTFGPGPGGRMSTEGSMPPRCNGCQSLERHRAFRAALSVLHNESFISLRVLQFSEDRAVNSGWFAEHEVSVWGGSNSLDLQAIDRPDASYDAVICNHVLEHVADDRAAMRELFRILRPGGFIFLSFPDPLRYQRTNDWGHPDESQHGHYRVYGRDVFTRMAETLPGAAIEKAVIKDPVTGTQEMFFLIGREVDTIASLITLLPDS